jgi:oligoribonuclease NrnB/cAMP/cGMP phosphodiesterase (DHH superfamily)
MDHNLRDDLYLFTDSDLDGAGCYFVLRKLIGKDFGHTQTTEKKFREHFLSLENKEKYKRIYICDLSVLEKNLDIIDLANIVYINHRNTANYKDVSFKNLRQESEDADSCTLLLYKKIKDKLKEPFTRDEKILISYINDYDSYALKFPESKKLHYLLHSFDGDRLLRFYNAFADGFKEFNDTQETIIKNVVDRINNTFNTLKIFKGVLKIGGEDVNVCSTFNNIFPSEICDMMLKCHECDVAISVNLNTSNVSIRKKKECNVNLGKFASKVFDGGGDGSVAGGKITKTFLELTKLLYPINES